MKVAILGTVDVSRAVAPFDQPEWEIWVCSPGNRGMVPRVTRWYEIHSLIDMLGRENAAWQPEYFAWLKAQSFQLIMQEHSEMFPQCTVYDRDRAIKRFGRNWFTSSVAWMMADAIIEMEARPGEQHSIGIFGVDMAADQEYHTQQKAGCTRFIELARDAGIEVFIPLESCLAVPPPLYGYAEASRMGRKLIVREFEINGMIATFEAQIQKIRDDLCYFRGAKDNNSYIRRTFVDGMDAILDTEVAQQRQKQAPLKHFSTVGIDGLTGAPKDDPRYADPTKPAPALQAPHQYDYTNGRAEAIQTRRVEAKRME